MISVSQKIKQFSHIFQIYWFKTVQFMLTGLLQFQIFFHMYVKNLMKKDDWPNVVLCSYNQHLWFWFHCSVYPPADTGQLWCKVGQLWDKC